MPQAKITIACDIIQKNDEQNLVFGWLYVARKADGEQVVDHSGEIVKIEDLEKASYEFVLESRKGGVMHEKDGETVKVRGRLVECIVFTSQKRMSMGIPEGMVPDGIWAGWKVDDETYADVKSGKLKMLSFGGHAKRETL